MQEDMKKKYEQPQIMIITVEQTDLLMLNTSIGDGAQEPARTREYEVECEW